MASLNRDELQLIAEQIDNPKTFYSFALVCKTTSQIAALLKPKKQFEFAIPKFWYNTSNKLAIPLVALNYHRVQIMLGDLSI